MCAALDDEPLIKREFRQGDNVYVHFPGIKFGDGYYLHGKLVFVLPDIAGVLLDKHKNRHANTRSKRAGGSRPVLPIYYCKRERLRKENEVEWNLAIKSCNEESEISSA